jgi:ferredoxin
MPEMVEATRRAYGAGKGIYAMKALAGGHLGRQFREALAWVRNLGCTHSVAVGMKSVAEVEVDTAVFEGRDLAPGAGAEFYAEKRIKVIQACTGCGSCVAVCPASALTLVDGKALCDPDACLTCGYCADACPNFAIRLV